MLPEGGSVWEQPQLGVSAARSTSKQGVPQGGRGIARARCAAGCRDGDMHGLMHTTPPPERWVQAAAAWNGRRPSVWFRRRLKRRRQRDGVEQQRVSVAQQPTVGGIT